MVCNSAPCPRCGSLERIWGESGKEVIKKSPWEIMHALPGQEKWGNRGSLCEVKKR